MKFAIRLLLVATLCFAQVLPGCAPKGPAAQPIDAAPRAGPPPATTEQERQGDASVQTGRWESALLYYDKALAVGAKRESVAYRKGLIQLARRSWTDALASFEEAVQAAPGLALAHEGAGIAAFKLNRLDEAAESFQKSAALVPDRFIPHAYLGVIHAYQNKPELAERDNLRALSLANSPALMNNLGMNYISMGEREKAVETFRKALDVDPGNKQILGNLGMALAEGKRYDEAMEAFRQSAGEAAALNNIGYYLYLEGRYEEAEERFEKAIEASPSYYAKANENLARVRLELSKQGPRTVEAPTEPAPSKGSASAARQTAIPFTGGKTVIAAPVESAPIPGPAPLKKPRKLKESTISEPDAIGASESAIAPPAPDAPGTADMPDTVDAPTVPGDRSAKRETTAPPVSPEPGRPAALDTPAASAISPESSPAASQDMAAPSVPAASPTAEKTADQAHPQTGNAGGAPDTAVTAETSTPPKQEVPLGLAPSAPIPTIATQPEGKADRPTDFASRIAPSLAVPAGQAPVAQPAPLAPVPPNWVKTPDAKPAAKSAAAPTLPAGAATPDAKSEGSKDGGATEGGAKPTGSTKTSSEKEAEPTAKESSAAPQPAAPPVETSAAQPPVVRTPVVLDKKGRAPIQPAPHRLDASEDLDAGAYSLLVYSFATEAEARKQIETLRQQGLDARVSAVDLGEKGVRHRVKVGAYATSEEAGTARRELMERYGFKDVVVLKRREPGRAASRPAPAPSQPAATEPTAPADSTP